jgi:hypothetical protein
VGSGEVSGVTTTQIEFSSSPGAMEGDVAGLTSLRLWRLLWFLRRQKLFDTALAYIVSLTPYICLSLIS